MRHLVWFVLASVGCGSGGHGGGAAADAGRDAAVAHDAAVTVDAAPATDAEVPRDAATDAPDERTVAEICGTLTAHADWEVIDPDDPTFSDASWTNDEVRAAFDTARLENTDAYRAYRMAHERPDLMVCGFCPCGCNGSLGHLSGIDCFKDMHGFG